MKITARPKIVLLVETSRRYGRDLLRGVSSFARTRTNWSMLHQEMTIDSTLPEWMAKAGPSGVIARVDTHTVDSLRALRVPIVDVMCSRNFPGIPRVETDNRIVTKLAFDHLWERGFRRFAYCGFRFARYSEMRRDLFRELVEQKDCPLDVYESPGKPNTLLMSLEESGLIDLEQMYQWLASLKFPTGIFVCNDIRGQQVLNACRTLDIAVPDDLAVIGVDDDDAICPLTSPPLTSVSPNAELVGYRAAEVLHEMMNGYPTPTSIELIRPTKVISRQSTEVTAVEDREVARICRLIRDHACEGINVETVAGFTDLSRRQLERRFRTELGRTLRQEITNVQLNKVKQLLHETDMTLEQISHLAGYSHKEQLCAVFKREVGQTPSMYRSSVSESS
ncbi:DNA-binding transcriptional regulator [Bremerella sp. JC770]|uniref:AraC family transcriptional regulator n=1 Tax=Bremerella sp. JC770 TaxID=3232137 RepID=UPI003458687D